MQKRASISKKAVGFSAAAFYRASGWAMPSRHFTVAPRVAA
jgi:hypothetical protein